MATTRLTRDATTLPAGNTRALGRAVRITGILLLAGIALFAAYYYWDRYLGPVQQHRTTVPPEVAKLESTIKANPDQVEPRVELATYYLAHGQNREAQAMAEQVLGADAANEAALLIGGEAALRLDQFTAAAARLRAFVDARKDLPMAATDQGLEEGDFFLGQAYLRLGQTADAVNAFEAALAISPIDADALYQAGAAYAAQGEHDKALARLEKAARLVYDFGEVYAAMAPIYTAQNRPAYAAYARGMQAYSVGDYRTALPQLRSAAAALPDYGPAVLGLGLTYEGLKDYATAQITVERALALDQDDLAARQAAGRIASALQGKP